MHTYIHVCYMDLVRQVSLWQPKRWCGPASNSMANNFIHHGPSARAHVPYSVLEFKWRSNYQQRNNWNFALPWFICSSQVTSINYRTIVNPSEVFSRFPNNFIIHGKFRQIHHTSLLVRAGQSRRLRKTFWNCLPLRRAGQRSQIAFKSLHLKT